MAIIGTFVTILHHRAARYLVLTTEPGTLAAAIALAGLSDIAHILDSKDTPEEMQAMLADLHFAIDPVCDITISVLFRNSLNFLPPPPPGRDAEHWAPICRRKRARLLRDPKHLHLALPQIAQQSR